MRANFFFYSTHAEHTHSTQAHAEPDDCECVTKTNRTRQASMRSKHISSPLAWFRSSTLRKRFPIHKDPVTLFGAIPIFGAVIKCAFFPLISNEIGDKVSLCYTTL